MNQLQQNIHSAPNTRPVLNKYSSAPKFRTMKQEIMRIPKVKQILHKDKMVYAQDIQKRIELIGSLKSDNYQYDEVKQLSKMRKERKKKTKRHKTNFKIPLTMHNVDSLNSVISEHIFHNQKYKNQEVYKHLQKDVPFDPNKLRFMDQINPLKMKYKQKFPLFKEGVLSRNKLLLEHVILNRNVKREMKLNELKQNKQLLKWSIKNK